MSTWYDDVRDMLIECPDCKCRSASGEYGLQDCPECAWNSNSPTRREELLQRKERLSVRRDQDDTYNN